MRIDVVLTAAALLAGAVIASCSTFGGEEGDGSSSDAGSSEASAQDASGQPDGGDGGAPGAVVEIASGEKGPGPVAANAAGVYWVDKEGSIRRSDRSKAAPITLAAGPPDAVDLRLDVTTLYAYSPSAPLTGSTVPCNVLFRVDTDGTKAQRINLAGCQGYVRMNVDATHVILGGAQLMLIPRQPGTFTFTPDGTFALGAVASDGATLFWARVSGPSIGVGPKGGDGSLNKLLAQSPSKPTDLTIDPDPSGAVYWLTEGGDVMAQPKQSPGAAPKGLAHGQPAPVRIVVDAAYVYWTNGSNGTVTRARKDGSAPPEAIASGLGSPFGLALAPGGLYVTTREGRILFIPLGG